MIKLRHILHPLRTTRNLYGRIQASASNKLTSWRMDRAYRGVTHMEQQKCWCGGEIPPFKRSPNFGVCVECGCYVNRHPPRPESLSEVYTFERYWRLRQKLYGLPPIERRADLYRSDGRVGYWLDLVRRHGPASGTVTEVGCSPGVLLAELERAGYKCTGVEPDEQTANWIRRTTGVEVRAGFFPGVSLPQCDLFMAFDVAEHVPDPLEFCKGISRILTPGGVAILQTPIEGRNFDNPFNGRLDFFNDIEHFFLFSEKSIHNLAESAHLQIVAIEDAMTPAGYLGQVCVLRKPSA